MSENTAIEQPKPGDVIEITWDGCGGALFGKRFTVIKRPPDAPDSHRGKNPGDAWFINEVGLSSYVTNIHYKIVQGKTAANVDQKLKQQLDNNLRSIFC